MKSAFDKIAAGLHDAIAFAEGDARRGRIVEGSRAMDDRDFNGIVAGLNDAIAYVRFDAASHLTDPADQAQLLAEAFANGDPAYIDHALATVVRARQIARPEARQP